MLTTKDREELRRLCEATGGPKCVFAEDEKFYAAARRRLPALLDEADARDAEVAELRACLRIAVEAAGATRGVYGQLHRIDHRRCFAALRALGETEPT
jgi:hypothetical protein